MTLQPSPGPQAPIEAVIFDLDGVLADTEPVHLEASRRVVAPAVIPLEQYARFVGGGADSYTEWIERTYSIPRPVFRERYTDTLVDLLRSGPTPAMRGADAVVRAIHRRGLRLAVASMSRPAWVQATLAATGLTDLFPLVVTGEEVQHPKPHPDIYLHTAALLGVEPHHCLAVEDSAHGVAAAAAAGMWVIQTRQASIFAATPQPGAHAVIDTFAAFDLGWLEGRPLPRAV
ncbi:MAG: HAD family phosphatase [Dehalococcoidia bacterium]|nr:HAD family phosphatase [Dehalococcoidia bacterium]